MSPATSAGNFENVGISDDVALCQRQARPLRLHVPFMHGSPGAPFWQAYGQPVLRDSLDSAATRRLLRWRPEPFRGGTHKCRYASRGQLAANRSGSRRRAGFSAFSSGTPPSSSELGHRRRGRSSRAPHCLPDRINRRDTKPLHVGNRVAGSGRRLLSKLGPSLGKARGHRLRSK